MKPKALAHVQDGEDLGPMQSCGDLFNCWKGVVLTPNGMIEVLRAQTYSQGAVLLGNNNHQADPWGGLLHQGNDSPLCQICQCVPKCLSKWHWESSRGVLDQADTLIHPDVVLALQSANPFTKNSWVLLNELLGGEWTRDVN